MFKLVSLLAFFTVVSSAPQYPFQSYSPYKAFSPAPFAAVTVAPFLPIAPVVPAYHVPSAESQAPILRQDQDVGEDGSYQYGYQTGNGITAQESGSPKLIGASAGTAAQGSYSYTSPEGKVVSISYLADENGFQAAGDVIPTPPPIPPAIARALAYIAAHPQAAEPQYLQKYY